MNPNESDLDTFKKSLRAALMATGAITLGALVSTKAVAATTDDKPKLSTRDSIEYVRQLLKRNNSISKGDTKESLPPRTLQWGDMWQNWDNWNNWANWFNFNQWQNYAS